ncbi:MAG: hypothetical protein MUC68_08100, partial [Burkholderiaceae bacterium]|nr:hypothetical protein [Burkholderiaceae bacterium]
AAKSTAGPTRAVLAPGVGAARIRQPAGQPNRPEDGGHEPDEAIDRRDRRSASNRPGWATRLSGPSGLIDHVSGPNDPSDLSDLSDLSGLRIGWPVFGPPNRRFARGAPGV